jgi:hypothetical protein
MTAVIVPETNGLNTHSNDLAAPVGSTSVADNVTFAREGRPERRKGFKDYSTNLPDFLPEQLIASAAGDQAYLHLDDGIWYNNGSSWTRKGGGPAYLFGSTFGIWVDDTETFAYLTDTSAHCVFKLEIATGYVSLLAGLPGTSGTANGTGPVARFNTPRGIWGDNTNLYVCDYANFSIRKIVISTGVVTTHAGLSGTSAYLDDSVGTTARFQNPHGIWGDGTNLYITENGGGRVRKVLIEGTQNTSTLVSGLTSPMGVWVANSGLLLYVVTNGGTVVKQVNPTTGFNVNLATGIIGSSQNLAHSGDGVYLWIAAWDGTIAYRVDILSGAVNNTVFSVGASQQGGVWSFAGSKKLWLTGNGSPQLLVAYPGTGNISSLISNAGAGGSIVGASGAKTFSSVVGPD